MENATNGLIMAGSVLISVIVLSLFVYLFSSMGSTAKEFQENIDRTAILKFNEPFEKYIGREDITPHEVLTAVNLAKERNNQTISNGESGKENDGYIIIDVEVRGGESVEDITEFLVNPVNEDVFYKCDPEKVEYGTAEYDGIIDETARISKIVFERVK